MVRCRKRLFMLAPLGVILSLGAAQAGDKGHKEVKISHVVSKPDADGKQKVTFTITPDDGWYIYANPVKNEEYAENATLIKAKGAILKVAYPPGKLKIIIDKETKKETRIHAYTGEVQIVAEIQRIGDSLVVLTVQYNACDGNRCLTTARVPFKID